MVVASVDFISTALSAQKTVEIGIGLNKIPLRRFAWRLCSNKSDVDDLVQETICNALEKAALYDSSYRILPWLFTMMRRINVDQFRRENRHADFVTASDADSGSVLLSRNWTIECRSVSIALDALTAPKRDAIIQIADGRDYASGALACGCDINTMKTRVRRARQELIAHVGDIF